MSKSKRVRLKRLLSGLLALSLIFSLISIGGVNPVHASETDGITDIEGHWAEKMIQEWMEQDIIKGYQDNTFRPDEPISRGELVALINRLLYLEKKSEVGFSDVEDGNWVFEDVAMAVLAGYIKGYKDGTFGADRPVTRQETAYILYTLLEAPGEKKAGDLSVYHDKDETGEWSESAVETVVGEGLMQGYEDNSFRPLASMTRAEAVAVLSRFMKSESTEILDEAGIYGPEKGIKVIRGNITVKAGTVLRNVIILGAVTVLEDSGEGQITFSNTRIFKNLNIKAKGIKIVADEDTVINRLVASKAVQVLGSGTILTAEIEKQGAGTSFEKPPLKIEGEGLAQGIPSPTATASPTPSNTPNPGENNGGNPEPEQTPVPTPEPTPVPTPNTTPTPVSTPVPTPIPTPIPKDSLKVVEAGQAKAFLLVPEKMDENMRYAAGMLKEYIQKSSGAQLEVKTVEEITYDEAPYQDMTRIYLGFAAAGDEAAVNAELAGMDGDGFIIRPGEDSITIIGPISAGTMFGASEFLERYVGVRWLMPGEDGEDVPQHENIAVPRNDYIKEEPAFMMRVFSPITGSSNVSVSNAVYGVEYEWSDRNRMHSGVEFKHNLYTIFPSEEFGESHPEIYPIRNGKTYIPKKDEKEGWQPRFTEPETVSIAVYKIIKYFEENQAVTSFSLGVNDGRGYCEAEMASVLKKNSVGLPDMSDIYYNWANEVVKGVREKYPDKWFGLPAYDNVADPPSFKLDSHIVPFIMKDRMSWIDSEVEAVGKEQMEKWRAVSENIGWYDYIYGLSYALPRVYTHKMAENYKYAKVNGVSAHYAELYPNWGEGPKPWICAKLQWNPDQDVDALLNEWYVRAVGPDAAPYLKQYYDHWEAFWTERVKGSVWFETYKNTTYLDYNNVGYLDLVTDEEIKESRRLLETVVEKAQTDKQRVRANMLLSKFEEYEASALSFMKIFEKEKFWDYMDAMKRGEADSRLVLYMVQKQANATEPSEEREYARLLLNILDSSIKISGRNL